MKKIFTLSALLCASVSFVYADLEGDGYYRAQNVSTGRFIQVLDNKGGVNVASMQVDLGALETCGPFASVVSDPSTILYISKAPGANDTYGPYDLAAQGTSAYSIVSEYLRLNKQGGTYYKAYAVKQGFTRYLHDSNDEGNLGCVLAIDDNKAATSNWDVRPVRNEEGLYFGLKPDFELNGKYYMSFYASFPFSFASSGMKAYYISQFDATFGIAVIEEILGEVPAATPVIVECSSADPASNKLNLLTSSPTAIEDNQMIGVYFQNQYRANYVLNSPATMRVIGVLSDGTLGLVKTPSTSQMLRMPRNRAYLPVPETAPEEMQLMTLAEYEAFVESQRVTLTARSYTRLYGEANPVFEFDTEGLGNVEGLPVLSCEATATTSVGTYPIVISEGSVTNPFAVYVNGTLTIEPASVTVTANDVSRIYGDYNPPLTMSYQGLKNGETDADIESPADATTEATKTSPVGTYPITVGGASAKNYVFTYVEGQLTVTPAPLIVRASDASREYGDPNPELTLTYEGFKNDEGVSALSVEPTLTTDAVPTSEVGEYAIVASGAQAQNYALTYTEGTLTIEPALLTVSVGNYEREEGEENPVFEILYEGFKNGEDVTVLASCPVATTDATKESPAGSYEIVVSSGEARNYTFNYVNGTLIVTQSSGISAVLNDARPVDVYSLTGVKIRSQVRSLEGLPRGIYIVGTRKVIIR